MSDPTTEIALAAAKPLVVKLLDALLKPVITVAQAVADPLVDLLGDRFSEYLARQLVKHSYLPTIVFQIRQPLEEIYVPLTVIEEVSFTEKNDAKRHKLDKYDKSFIPEKERVLIIDGAGMGKTTLSRFLFTQSIKSLATVPVFIELRHLTSEKTILDYLVSELNPVSVDSKDLKIDKRQITRLLDNGIFTFFLDGYDEVSNVHLEKVTRDIKNITETYPKNKFLITSRPEHALASFPAFHAYRIVSLKREEAFTLIRKYDKNGERGERLIEKLSDKSLREIDDFLKNPLLTTLLYRAYDYKNQIPLKKPNFYRQVFDALFEWHDLTKDGYSTREKISKLDIDGFHKVLRGVGFVSTMKGRVEANTDEMLDWIREAKTYCPELKFSESDFLEDAIKAVPVFRREGGTILWSHKSLAEYFCAQFIVTDAKTDQRNICEFLVESFRLPSFRNLLDLLYDMDVGLFGQYFVKRLIQFYESEFDRLKLIHNSQSIKLIEERAAATFGRRPFVIGEGKKARHVFSERLREVSSSATRDWWQDESKLKENDFFDQRLTLEITDFSTKSVLPNDRRVLSLSHPLRTVFAILIAKKHSLVTLSPFYPPGVEKSKILGIAHADGLPLNEQPNAIWNSSKNFQSTTFGLMRTVAGVLNTARIPSVLHEIEQLTGRSQTTANLLASFDRRESA
jgi:NACHT domain